MRYHKDGYAKGATAKIALSQGPAGPDLGQGPFGPPMAPHTTWLPEWGSKPPTQWELCYENYRQLPGATRGVSLWTSTNGTAPLLGVCNENFRQRRRATRCPKSLKCRQCRPAFTGICNEKYRQCRRATRGCKSLKCRQCRRAFTGLCNENYRQPCRATRAVRLWTSTNAATPLQVYAMRTSANAVAPLGV